MKTSKQKASIRGPARGTSVFDRDFRDTQSDGDRRGGRLPRRLPSLLLALLLLGGDLTISFGASGEFEIPTIVDSTALAVEQAQRLVVMVTAELDGHLRQGAGVVFAADAKRALIATSIRLVRDYGENRPKLASNVAVRFRMLSGQSRPARIEMSRENFYDVAVLSVDLPADAPRAMSGFRFDLIGQAASLRRGSPVFPVGHSHGQAWAVPIEADMVDRVEETIHFQSSYLGDGSLGTAAFDDQWKLVGMLMQEATPPTTHAVRIDPLLAYLRGLGFPVYLSRPGKSNPGVAQSALPPLPRIDTTSDFLSIHVEHLSYLPAIPDDQWLLPNIQGRSASMRGLGGSPDFRLEVMTNDRQRQRVEMSVSKASAIRMSVEKLGRGADFRIVEEDAANDEVITEWQSVGIDALRRGVRIQLRIRPEVFLRYPELPGDRRSIALSLRALPD
jgi:hypothetical protein